MPSPPAVFLGLRLRRYPSSLSQICDSTSYRLSRLVFVALCKGADLSVGSSLFAPGSHILCAFDYGGSVPFSQGDYTALRVSSFRPLRFSGPRRFRRRLGNLDRRTSRLRHVVSFFSDTFSINIGDLLAMQLVLSALVHRLVDRRVAVFCDTTSTVSYLRRSRVAFSPSLIVWAGDTLL